LENGGDIMKTELLFVMYLVVLVGVNCTFGINNVTILAGNESVECYFNIIADLPYDSDGGRLAKAPSQLLNDGKGDCDDKATAFADYLYNIGERNIHMIYVYNSEECHCFLFWNGKAYDPTNHPAIYEDNYNDYLYDSMTQNNFTKVKAVKYTPGLGTRPENQTYPKVYIGDATT